MVLFYASIYDSMCVMQGGRNGRHMDVNLDFLRGEKQIMYFESTWIFANDGAQHFGDLSISNVNILYWDFIE